MKSMLLSIAFGLLWMLSGFSQQTDLTSVDILNVISSCNNPLQIIETQAAPYVHIELDVETESEYLDGHARLVLWDPNVGYQSESVIELGYFPLHNGIQTLKFNLLDALPGPLTSNVYESRLLICYKKRPIIENRDQVIRTTLLGADLCTKTLEISDYRLCCEYDLGCVSYVDCPDLAMTVDRINEKLRFTIPGTPYDWHIRAEQKTGSISYEYESVHSIDLQPGCWIYSIYADYPNGCRSRLIREICEPQDYDGPITIKWKDIEHEGEGDGRGGFPLDSIPGGGFPWDGIPGDGFPWEGERENPWDGIPPYDGSQIPPIDGNIAADQNARLLQSRRTAASSSLNFYPVPFTDLLFLTTSVEGATLRISNIQGQLILEKNLGEGHQKISTSHWPSGIYLASLSKGKEILQQQKIIK